MALDDFITLWERVEKVNEIAKAMSDNRGDEEAANEFYKDLVKQAKKVNDTYGKLAPAEDAGMDAKLSFAQEFQIAARDAAYNYSNKNIEGIVKDAKPKLGEHFPGVVATIEPKTKKDEHKALVDVIKKYREAREPLQTSRENPRPRLNVVIERLHKLIEKKLGDSEELEPYVKALKRFYERKDEFALEGYQRNIVKPAEDKLAEVVGKENVPAYMRDNLAEFKKAERAQWYNLMNKALAEAA